MYEKAKKIIKSIVPKKVLEKNEDKIRALIALKYKGNAVFCNICSSHFSSFIELNNGELLCPKCGCLPRTRRLFSLIEQEPDLDKKKVLHFSPPKALRKKLSETKTGSYTTTDFEGEFEADKHLNIEAIEEPDNQYDYIICYHVLEHIIKDVQAMGELYRILKPNGKCFIQTPFKEGDVYEDYTITSKEEREKHFGQHDHVRIYSEEALKNRLESVGFKVEVNHFTAESKRGFKEETVFEAIKIKA